MKKKTIIIIVAILILAAILVIVMYMVQLFWAAESFSNQSWFTVPTANSNMLFDTLWCFITIAYVMFILRKIIQKQMVADNPSTDDPHPVQQDTASPSPALAKDVPSCWSSWESFPTTTGANDATKSPDSFSTGPISNPLNNRPQGMGNGDTWDIGRTWGARHQTP